MKKILKIIGIGTVILIIGGIGGLIVNYIVFAKISTHPVWSQNSIIKALDNRIRVIKTTEKIVVADNESIADIASRAAGSVVYVEIIDNEGKSKQGNGVIVSSDGVIATTTQIISSDKDVKIFVKLGDGTIKDVNQVYFDNHNGIVFLRIDAQNLATVSFANSDDARSGKRLISISRPRSGDEERFALGGFFGRDNLFSINKPISDFLQGILLIDFSQSVLEESIGAPVVDFKGNMVGMVSVNEVKDVKNFYAIAANDIYESFEIFLKNQENNDDENRAILGVDYKIITSLDVHANDIEITSGAIIFNPETYVEQSDFAKTLAAKSGLRGGDIVIMVNNDTIDEKNNLSRLMYKNKDEEKITLKVLRGDELLSVEVIK